MEYGRAAVGRVLKAEDQFHLGIVVEDFETSLTEFTSLFGYEWSGEVRGPVPVTLPGGDTVVEMGCVFSTTAPRLEVVRRVPGTLWEPAAGGAVHHVGYWSDDIAADAAELVRHGFVEEAKRSGADGASFAFLRSPVSGYRVELVSRLAQSGLKRLWGEDA